jgi:hypothetical protein
LRSRSIRSLLHAGANISAFEELGRLAGWYLNPPA